MACKKLIEVNEQYFFDQVKYISENFNTFSYTNLTFSHGESPVWEHASGTLFWVDVLQQDVHALHYASKRHTVKHISKYLTVGK